MKVYLLYRSYDDDLWDESRSDDYLEKIVDSEEKAKKWVFKQAVEKCIELANEECELKEVYAFYLNQLKRLTFGGRKYSIGGFNGSDVYGFRYEIGEVE